MSAGRSSLNTPVESEGGNLHGCCWNRCAQAHAHFCWQPARWDAQLGELTVLKRPALGITRRCRWAREQFGTELIWGIEDCRHLSARLERDLLGAGQQVVRVPPKLMAQTAQRRRGPGVSLIPIDALAVARAVLREPDLPVASHDEVSRELKLLD